MEKTETNIVQEIIDFYTSSMKDFSIYYQEAQKNIDAVYGDPFTQKQKQKISKEGRTPFGLKLMFPKIQALKGFEKENRDHLEAEPFGAEDELTTELINQLIRHIEIQDKPKKYEFTKSDIYEDCIVPAYGASEIYIETNEFKKKEVFIKQIPYNQILFDQNYTDYEMTSSRRFQQHWQTYLDDLIDEFPDRKAEFEKSVDEGFQDLQNFPQREFKDAYDTNSMEPGRRKITRIRDWKLVQEKMWYLNDILNKTKYEFTTKKEAEEKRDELVKEPVNLFVTPQQANGFPVQSGNQNGTIPSFENFIIESEVKPVWQYTEIAGTVLIEEPTIIEVPDESPITITYSINLMGKWYTPAGIMRQTQEFIDKLFQQLDYSIGIDSKGGAEVNVDILATEHNSIDQIKVAYVNGELIFKHGNGQLFDPMKRTGANPQYFTLFEMFFKILEDGFGGRNFQGNQEAGGQQSGRAISQLLAVAQSLTNNYLDNLRRADLLMGRKLVKYIKKCYDYEFSMSVIGDALQQEVVKALQENNLYQPSLLKEGKGWLTYDPSKNNVKPISDASVVLNLSKVSSRLDEKELTRASLMALQQQGYGIPLEAMLDTLPLKATMKSKILSYNKQLQAKQEQIQLQQMKMEALQKQQDGLNKSADSTAKLMNAKSSAINSFMQTQQMGENTNE